MKDSFVFYESFYDILQMLPDAEDWRTLVEAVCEYAFTDKHEPLPNPMLEIAFKHFQISIDSSSKRYQKAVEDGQKGGRPSKREFIPPEVWIGAILEHGSIPKAATALGLSKPTLYKWVNASNDQRLEKVKKLKNPSVSVSVSDSDAVAYSDSDTKRNSNKKAPDAPTTDPNGSPSRPATKRKSFEEMWVPPD